jgi:hypothetical protein
MTLVFRTQGPGQLQQVQVGPADIIATLSASTSAWGWVGGLAGIRRVLNGIRSPYGCKEIENLGLNLNLLPATCHIITSSHGVVYLQDNDIEDAFGGDARTQLLGLTICALAHELGGSRAIKLFMRTLAPILLGATDAEQTAGFHEALHLNLVDNCQRILNEGASRGLTERFEDMIEDLRLFAPHRTPGLKDYASYDDDYYLAGGLLRWLGNRKQGPYLTRSASCARLAACLKVVDYSIGAIRVWDGTGAEPGEGVEGVTLVLGGSVETDILMLGGDERPSQVYFQTHHYRLRTVGSMIFNSLRHESGLWPEVFQTDFTVVNEYLTDNLQFEWQRNPLLDLGAVAQWQPRTRAPSSMSLRLATIYFPTCAEKFADCYTPLGNEDDLRTVVEKTRQIIQPLPNALARFRGITTSILLSIACMLGGKDFDTLQHATLLDLVKPGQIAKMCEHLDNALSSTGIPMWKAAIIVATFHSASNPSFLKEFPPEKHYIGARNGIYAVLPAVLLEMAPNRDALGFRCVDKFYCNLPVHPDGWIRSGESERWFSTAHRDLTSGEHLRDLDGFLGPPKVDPPDAPLYLSIERFPNQPEPDLWLAARVHGDVVGVVGIYAILHTLTTSVAIPQHCPGHQVPSEVLNVKASTWTASRFTKPLYDHDFYHSYVSAKQDRCWAIFLAGQAAQAGGQICFGCFDCGLDSLRKFADRADISPSMFIGYG